MYNSGEIYYFWGEGLAWVALFLPLPFITHAGQDGVDGEGGDATEKEKEMEEEKKPENARMYISPWERAMKGDTELTATMKVEMPGPYIYQDPPSFKSFNRWVAWLPWQQVAFLLLSLFHLG